MTVAYPPDLVPSPPTVDEPDLTDLPPYMLSSKFVQAYLNCLALELQRIETARQEILLSWFPASAGTTLEFFEQMLGLAVNPVGLTITERQNLVLAYMQALKSEGTGLAWEASIQSFIRGPWSYVESPATYTVTISLSYSAAVRVPIGLGGVPNTSSGTLAAGTYYYAVTATTLYGETLPCTPVEVVTTGTGEVVLTWTANPTGPTTGYNVYRSEQGTEDEIFGGSGTFGGTGTFGASSTTPGVLYLIGNTTATTLTDTGLAAGPKIAPGLDTSAAPTGQAVAVYARIVTPAHIAVVVENSG